MLVFVTFQKESGSLKWGLWNQSYGSVSLPGHVFHPQRARSVGIHRSRIFICGLFPAEPIVCVSALLCTYQRPYAKETISEIDLYSIPDSRITNHGHFPLGSWVMTSSCVIRRHYKQASQPGQGRVVHRVGAALADLSLHPCAS